VASAVFCGVMGMSEDFFSGIEQVEMKFNGGVGKLPIFYRGVRSFSLMVPASYFALKRLLPDPRFIPAQAAPGVGIITLSAFEYSETDIGPYNEFSVGIVLNNPYFLPLPAYNLTKQYLTRFYCVYVYRLPVTTEIALRAGVDFYNFPKFIADIEFSDTEESVSCRLSQDDTEILTIKVPRIPTRTLGEMKFIAHLYHNRQPQMAEFKINVVDGAIKWLPGPEASWSFNNAHPYGKELNQAVLGTRAVSCLYMPRIQGILYGPEHLSIPLIDRAMRTVTGK